uniref:Uncharacterized protein n=1 Tax=Arundo donax TaxID=35708 RepID=A0A0A9DVA6_ARUDO
MSTGSAIPSAVSALHRPPRRTVMKSSPGNEVPTKNQSLKSGNRSFRCGGW